MTDRLTSIYIYRRLAASGVSAFTVPEFRGLLGLDAGRAHQILHRLEGQRFLKRLSHGRYLLTGLQETEALAQPLYLGTRLVEPSYVSFWSALHFHGWTEQAPRVTFIANTHHSGDRRVEPFAFRLVKLQPARFFGYELARQGTLEFPLAEPEKAILDSLYLPECAGGVGEVARAVEEALEGLDVKRLESYAVRMGVRSLCSRLGFLLERLEIDSQALAQAASAVYVKLDPSGVRRGRYNSRWKILDNLRTVG